MYISDTDNNRLTLLRAALYHAAFALFLAVLGAVYEHFSHGVYSFFMIYAFVFPLAMGTLAYIALGLFSRRLPGRVSRWLWNAGTVTLSLGSVFEGVLEIYGTANDLVLVYWFLGATLALAGVIYFFVSVRETKPSNPK